MARFDFFSCLALEMNDLLDALEGIKDVEYYFSYEVQKKIETNKVINKMMGYELKGDSRQRCMFSTEDKKHFIQQFKRQF